MFSAVCSSVTFACSASPTTTRPPPAGCHGPFTRSVVGLFARVEARRRYNTWFIHAARYLVVKT